MAVRLVYRPDLCRPRGHSQTRLRRDEADHCLLISHGNATYILSDRALQQDPAGWTRAIIDWIERTCAEQRREATANHESAARERAKAIVHDLDVLEGIA